MSPTDPLSDPRDYILDLSSMAPAGSNTASETDGRTNAARPFLSILFRCCKVYQRVYRTADGTAYAGHCPKCAKPARIKIGSGGTQTRFFTAE